MTSNEITLTRSKVALIWGSAGKCTVTLGQAFHYSHHRHKPEKPGRTSLLTFSCCFYHSSPEHFSACHLTYNLFKESPSRTKPVRGQCATPPRYNIAKVICSVSDVN